MFELYRYNSDIHREKILIPDNYILKVRKLSIFNWIYSKHPIYDLYWFINTLGECWVFTVLSNKKEVHYSYATKPCIKFNFMKENDLQIGNCFTSDQHRGCGIYPYVIQSIIEYFNSDINNIFMLIENDNTSSQRGVKKIGFEKTATLNIKKFIFLFKIYVLK